MKLLLIVFFLLTPLLKKSEQIDIRDEPVPDDVKAAAFSFLRNVLTKHWSNGFPRSSEFWPFVRRLNNAGPQSSVVSPMKAHALFLWIHLVPKEQFYLRSARVVANMDAIVESVVPRQNMTADNEILYGVGFGPTVYKKLGLTPVQSFTYPYREGYLGDLPSTGGDIFVHAKSNSRGDLFYLARKIKTALPTDSIAQFSDTYGFEYRDGRDLSGFIDGTQNPATNQDRYQVAVNQNSFGSFCLTQRWVHNFDVLSREKTATLESWVGRRMNDSVELIHKSPTSHVARMTSGAEFKAKKPFQIVRQSLPYGDVGEKAGLFFLAFAASPDNFEYMLSRMTGRTPAASDDIMRLSKCESGTYWYLPSTDDMAKLRSGVI